MQLENAARNASANAIVDLVDIGSTNPRGRFYIYDTGETNLLATIPLNDPAFNAAVGGTVSLIVIPDVQNDADDTGPAAEFTLVDKDDNVIAKGSVGVSGSGKDMILNSVNLEAGVPVKITACNITVPAGSPA